MWTLKLRPNIKFTDGTPFDAAAVKFNWQRLQDPNQRALLAAKANQMQSMDVIDTTTLRITLKEKNAQFPNSVVLMSFIGSPTAIQQRGNQFAGNPVGAGSFQFKSWVRNSALTLVRNPNYWNAPLPYLDQIVFKPVSEEQRHGQQF